MFHARFVSCVVAAAVLASLTGCGSMNSGSNGGGAPTYTAFGAPTDRVVTAMNGKTYRLADLDPLGGTMTLPNGVVVHSFQPKRSFGDKIGTVLGQGLGAAAGGLGGAYAGRAISSGPIGTSVGAVTGGAIGSGTVGAATGDRGVVWVSADQLGTQNSPLAAAR